MLTTVLDRLQRANKVEPDEQHPIASSPRPSEASLRNAFETLVSSEHDDLVADTGPADRDATPSSSAPGLSSRRGSNIIAELEDPIDDKAFTLYCYLEGCTSARRKLRKTWLEYLNGSITLEHASLLTEAAIDVLQSSASDITLRMPEFDDFDAVADFLQMRAVVAPETMFKPDKSIFRYSVCEIQALPVDDNR